MRANELMTGDLVMVNKDGVCIPKGTIVRVVEVDSANKFPKKGFVGSALCVDVNDRSVSGGIWCEYLSPIPLTPEILEKNGFEKSEYGWYNRKIVEWEIEIYIGRIETFVKINKGVFPHINNADCRFLHQLQHALRLCGIEKEITI